MNDSTDISSSETPATGFDWRKFVLSAFVVGVFALILGGLGGRAYILAWAAEPHGDRGRVAIVIKPGTPLDAITDRLEAEGIIDSRTRFLAFTTIIGRRGAIQAGEYLIALPISPNKLVGQLQRGSFQKKFTIPEGWTASQIGRALIDQGWIETQSEWLEVVSRPLPDSSGSPGDSAPLGFALPGGAEGFCFPDTYYFEPGTTTRQMRDRMLAEFARVWREIEPGRRDPRSERFGPIEVVTLASMIEREARGDDELAQIASVYLNRLTKRMKLQCCATIHYALGEVWTRPLKYADLKIDSPYNTYLHRGLPPGPIGNPGRKALEAVLRPADTPYLFYVYRGDGTHEFTKTYAEHKRASRKYLGGDEAASFTSGRSAKNGSE